MKEGPTFFSFFSASPPLSTPFILGAKKRKSALGTEQEEADPIQDTERKEISINSGSVISEWANLLFLPNTWQKMYLAQVFDLEVIRAILSRGHHEEGPLWMGPFTRHFLASRALATSMNMKFGPRVTKTRQTDREYASR